VPELAVRFGVSEVTIRKDLDRLADMGRVVRLRGGATPAPPTRRELAFDLRDRVERHAKDEIGAGAASLVHDGESIILDASTTALYVARHLMRRSAWHALTVVTNSIRIGEEMAGEPGVSVLLLGGLMRWESLSVVGPLGDAVFSRVHAQRAFLGAAGFTIGQGLTDAHEEEAQMKRAMVATAQEVYGVIDHTKWGRLSSVTFCPTDQLSGIVTDPAAPSGIVGELEGRGIEVIIAGLRQRRTAP
jgi:DeoR/GlpR family transcriptional regulator of sugar metabolism